MKVNLHRMREKGWPVPRYQFAFRQTTPGELTRERLILSGIERLEEPLILKVEDFAQTWVCWLDV